jgi:hypothetical protein
MQKKILKLVFLSLNLTLILITTGCKKSNSLNQPKIPTAAPAIDLEHSFKRSPIKECKGLESEWISENELKLKFISLIESRGSRFKKTAILFDPGQNALDVYIIEDFCKENCPQKSNRECLVFDIKDLKKNNYLAEIHRTEKITPGGVIKKIEIPGEPMTF